MRKYKKLFSMLVFIFVAFLCVFSNVSTAQADTPLPCSEVTQPINLTGITSVSTGASLQSTGLRFTYTSGVYRGSDATTPDILDSGTATSYSWRNHSISINVLYTTTPEINAKRGDYIPCDNFYISLPEEVFYVIRKKPSNSLVSSGNGRYDHTAGNGEFEIEYVWQEDVIEYKRTNIYYIQAYATFKVDSIAPSVNLSCKNGEFTNENVTVTYSDNLSGVKSAQYNGTSEANFSEKILIDFSSGRIFNAAGNYTIKVVDNAGWETTKTFTIDKTAPVLTLFGVTDAGYTNKNVSATWTEECTSVTSQLSNPNDQLTVRYARNASGDYPTETTTEYGQGAVLSENGKYLMTISDRAGNSTSYTFTIDKTAPTGTLTNVTDGGYTNKNVTFSWSNSEESATLDGVAYSSGTTISEERLHTIVLTDLAGNSTTYTFTIDKTAPTGTLTNVTDGGYTNKNVTFSWSDSGASATLNDAVYFSGTAISAERQYILVLTDRATNSTTYTFTIDKTAPKLTVSVGNRVHTNQGVTVSYSDTGSSASGLYGREESLNYPTANTRFSSGREFSNEGSYTITVTDLAGNTSSHYFTIDKTAPVIGSYPSFTNSAFTLSAQDKYGSVGAWEYRLNGGTVQRNNDAVITLGGGMQSNGVWNLRAIDELGNTSNWVTVNHAFRETFGNADNVANAYNAPTYYVVTLSQKNYVSCFGSYTFAEYDHALSFAIEKEWACRVIKLDGGKSWNYVTATNENARQIYTDRSELNAVIERYARRNISDRRVVGKNGVVLNNPTDAHGVTRADALTVQLARLPALLNAYSGMRFMLAQQSAALETPQRIVDGNKSTATIQFISDGISVREGQVLSLRYGDPLSSVVNEQGWYMIIESDICGNDEKYLIYIDLQQPDLTAKVAYGNGESDIIAFNQSYVDENTETMRYTEFSVQNLSDNIDQYSMIAISGRNLSGQYVWGDELPVISYENGYYGSYTITIYDRSLNTLELTIYIAGAAPTLKHTSLTNETACTFTVMLNDSRNEITDIKFYKVHFDGTEEQLYVDSYDNAVSPDNLEYRMNVGGKYVFEFTDLYGRTVRTDPIFYMKGLPTATLRGVKDGGLTKNDVSILYDANATAELYRKVAGEWSLAELYEIAQGVSGYTMRITASPETTATYKVLLYITEDRNLFTEYTFEIDGILPSVDIVTDQGDVIGPETVTTQNFYITWQENGYKAFYKKQGTLSDLQYARETLITTAGTYVFTFYDEARNELTFSVTLDNVVSYSLDGTYTLLEDGSYITRGNFVFTLTEPWAQFDVEASNGLTVVNGQRLDTDGTYQIFVKDMYGNALSLTLIVDKLPPEPTILSSSGMKLSNGARTRESFSVSCEEENVSIVYAQGSGSYVVYDGSLVDEKGTYSFRLTDRVGNVAIITVVIDREVLYRIDGNFTEFDGIYCSRTWIQITALETVATFTIETADGILVDNTKRIKEEGRYYVKLVDVAGNEVELSFEIDKTPPTAIINTLSGRVINGGAVNESFKAVCDEPDCIATFTDGINGYMEYDGHWIEIAGNYTFRFIDRLGNVATLSVVVNYDVAYEVDGTYVFRDWIYYSRSWLQVNPLETVATFTIETADGILIDTSKRVSGEGTYYVKLIDVAGNAVTFTLVIDKTAPKIQIVTASGTATDAITTGEAFRFTSEEPDAKLKYNFNNSGMLEYDGTWLADAGKYTLSATDFLGNVAELEVVIDKSVSLTVNGTYVFDDDAYISKSWISITLREEMQVFYIRSQSGIEYGADTRIATEGSYEVYAQDKYGNSTSFLLTIDVTAPTINLSGVSSDATTNSPVTVEFVDYFEASYRLNGGEKVLVTSGAEFSEEGSYLLSVRDLVGNVSSVSFVIDRHVDITPSVDLTEGRIITEAISFSFGETIIAMLCKDGTENVYARGAIAEAGNYILTAADNYGNVKTFRWTIVPKRAREFVLSLQEGIEVSIEKDGVLFGTQINNDTLVLTDNGRYSLLFMDGDEHWTLELEVDNVAPTLEFENTGKSIKLHNPNKSAVTYTLYLNGEKKTFNFQSSAELTAIGDYKLVCVDDLGNTTEYEFELNYLSPVTIALIVVVSCLGIIGIITLLAFRFKRKIF